MSNSIYSITLDLNLAKSSSLPLPSANLDSIEVKELILKLRFLEGSKPYLRLCLFAPIWGLEPRKHFVVAAKREKRKLKNAFQEEIKSL